MLIRKSLLQRKQLTPIKINGRLSMRVKRLVTGWLHFIPWKSNNSISIPCSTAAFIPRIQTMIANIGRGDKLKQREFITDNRQSICTIIYDAEKALERSERFIITY
jgi:hypothetical protein